MNARESFTEEWKKTLFPCFIRSQKVSTFTHSLSNGSSPLAGGLLVRNINYGWILSILFNSQINRRQSTSFVIQCFHSVLLYSQSKSNPRQERNHFNMHKSFGICCVVASKQNNNTTASFFSHSIIKCRARKYNFNFWFFGSISFLGLYFFLRKYTVDSMKNRLYEIG